MFKSLKKMFGKDEGEILLAPMNGTFLAVQEVPDPTFAEEMLGPGVAIMPTEGKLYAPADGVMTLVFDTLHAVAMTTTDGAELLFHIGLDTVKEQGEGFTAHIKVDDKVKAGDLLVSFDLAALKEKGYNLITPMILTNKSDFAKVEIMRASFGQTVSTADTIMVLKKA